MPGFVLLNQNTTLIISCNTPEIVREQNQRTPVIIQQQLHDLCCMHLL